MSSSVEGCAWIAYAVGVLGAFAAGVASSTLFRGDPGLRSRAVLALLGVACVLLGAAGLV